MYGLVRLDCHQEVCKCTKIHLVGVDVLYYLDLKFSWVYIIYILSRKVIPSLVINFIVGFYLTPNTK